MPAETEQIKARYQRRDAAQDQKRYDPLNPGVLLSIQERERAICRVLRETGMQDVQRLRVLEVGCGTGANLLQFLRLGFRPENLSGNDLISDRIAEARRRLPGDVQLHCGDALEISPGNQSYDLVLQSTVFTSIVDGNFQESLAERMWECVSPGGGILWYDFAYDNPRNPDVKGVPASRIYRLFPHAADIRVRRITLAPPISRLVTRIHPSFYTLCNLFPFLRTHILAWIMKAPPDPR